MMIAALLALTLALSFGLTWQLRRYAIARGMLDVPNARSSHVRPTLRGGGLAIVLFSLLGLSALEVVGVPESGPVAAAFALGALLVAMVSWLDDLGVHSYLMRFAAQGLAALAQSELDGGGSIQSLLDLASFRPVTTAEWTAWGEDGRSWFSVDTREALAAGLDAYGSPPR